MRRINWGFLLGLLLLLSGCTFGNNPASAKTTVVASPADNCAVDPKELHVINAIKGKTYNFTLVQGQIIYIIVGKGGYIDLSDATIRKNGGDYSDLSRSQNGFYLHRISHFGELFELMLSDGAVSADEISLSTSGGFISPYQDSDLSWLQVMADLFRVVQQNQLTYSPNYSYEAYLCGKLIIPVTRYHIQFG